jgi:hypothetical protein
MDDESDYPVVPFVTLESRLPDIYDIRNHHCRMPGCHKPVYKVSEIVVQNPVDQESLISMLNDMGISSSGRTYRGMTNEQADIALELNEDFMLWGIEKVDFRDFKDPHYNVDVPVCEAHNHALENVVRNNPGLKLDSKLDHYKINYLLNRIADDYERMGRQ